MSAPYKRRHLGVHCPRPHDMTEALREDSRVDLVVVPTVSCWSSIMSPSMTSSVPATKRDSSEQR
jgi:hypothetical protein